MGGSSRSCRLHVSQEHGHLSRASPEKETAQPIGGTCKQGTWRGAHMGGCAKAAGELHDRGPRDRDSEEPDLRLPVHECRKEGVLVQLVRDQNPLPACAQRRRFSARCSACTASSSPGRVTGHVIQGIASTHWNACRCVPENLQQSLQRAWCKGIRVGFRVLGYPTQRA